MQISISYLGGWVAARLMQVNQQIREPRSPGPMAPWPMVSRGRDVKSACTDNRSYMDCWDYTGWGTGLLSISRDVDAVGWFHSVMFVVLGEFAFSSHFISHLTSLYSLASRLLLITLQY